MEEFDIKEQRLAVNDMFNNSVNIVVCDADSYKIAGDMARDIKRMQTKVTDYWEVLRKPAKEAYDSVLARKKEMLEPLKVAEKELKKKMSDYTIASEKARAQREAERIEAATSEKERLLNEAAEMEARGDSTGAEFAVMEAEMMENAALATSETKENLSMKGVSQRKAWEITSIDISKVPVSIGGVVIRPVDEKAVKKLIKESNGSIVIPGVEYSETVSISVRQ